MKPNIQAFFDPNTSAISYIICEPNNNCAIIDPILDYDPAIARTSTIIVNRMIDYIDKNI